jgi:DNA-binding ferritin-like protein
MKAQDFRDYHLLLVEHAEQIVAITDDVGERARQIGRVPSAPLAKYRNSNASRNKK